MDRSSPSKKLSTESRADALGHDDTPPGFRSLLNVKPDLLALSGLRDAGGSKALQPARCGLSPCGALLCPSPCEVILACGTVRLAKPFHPPPGSFHKAPLLTFLMPVELRGGLPLELELTTVGRVVAWERPQPGRLPGIVRGQLRHVVGHRIEKVPVVRNHQHRRAAPLDPCGQRIHTRSVQMVRGLVEYEHIRVACRCARDPDTGALSGAEGLNGQPGFLGEIP